MLSAHGCLRRLVGCFDCGDLGGNRRGFLRDCGVVVAVDKGWTPSRFKSAGDSGICVDAPTSKFPKLKPLDAMRISRKQGSPTWAAMRRT